MYSLFNPFPIFSLLELVFNLYNDLLQFRQDSTSC